MASLFILVLWALGTFLMYNDWTDVENPNELIDKLIIFLASTLWPLWVSIMLVVKLLRLKAFD